MKIKYDYCNTQYYHFTITVSLEQAHDLLCHILVIKNNETGGRLEIVSINLPMITISNGTAEQYATIFIEEQDGIINPEQNDKLLTYVNASNGILRLIFVEK